MGNGFVKNSNHNEKVTKHYQLGKSVHGIAKADNKNDIKIAEHIPTEIFEENKTEEPQEQHITNRYPCNKCDVPPFPVASKLKYHKATIHKRYSCDQCDIQPAMNKSSLRIHKESAHESVRYDCAWCNKSFTFRTNLRKHTKTVQKEFVMSVKYVIIKQQKKTV